MAKENNPQSGLTPMEETLNRSEAFFLKYQKHIIGTLAAIIIVVAAGILYHTYVAVPKAQKDSTALAKGQEFFAAGQYDIALNGDSASFVGFAKLAGDLSGDAGNLANLYAGLCYAQLDKWQEAVNYIEKFDGRDDQMISPAALGALGNAYAHLNQLDKAVATLKKAAEQADNNSLSPREPEQEGRSTQALSDR